MPRRSGQPSSGGGLTPRASESALPQPRLDAQTAMSAANLQLVKVPVLFEEVWYWNSALQVRMRLSPRYLHDAAEDTPTVPEQFPPWRSVSPPPQYLH